MTEFYKNTSNIYSVMIDELEKLIVYFLVTAKTQCSDDTSCPSDLMCVGGACADPCKVLPDVCREAKIPSGICIARNHRALCSCPSGKSLNAAKECISSEEERKPRSVFFSKLRFEF
jgi:hypothetical protein